MEVLLDTHALVWWFEGAAMLSSRVSAILADSANVVDVSAVIGWEIAIKFNAGKFRSTELVDDMVRILAEEGWRELPISLQHAMRAALLPVHHRDPFDRLLVAQAQAMGVPILSADRALDTYDVRRLW